MRKTTCCRLPFLALQIAPDENIEKLIGAADFHVRLHHHRIPALHDRILDFVQMHRLAALDAPLEILALQHLLQRDARIEPHHFLEGHHLKPLAVEDGARACGSRILNACC